MSIPAYSIQNVLKRAQQLDISTAFQPYSGVEIDTGAQDDDGNEIIYTAGDASGRVLTIYNEWGTQTQANNILAAIKGFAYQPYTASGALVDPSAELGDGVSVNDVYSGIYRISRNYSSLMSADIQAPQSEEIDHEYPYESTQNRENTRKFSAMSSELRMNSQEISAKVSQDGGAQNSVSWSLKSSAWSVYANGNLVFRVNSSGAQVVGKITATSGKIGGFDINLNGSNAIQYNGLTWNGNKTGIYLGPSGLQIGSKSGSFFQASASGDVRAHNLYLTGELNMGGVKITPQSLANKANTAYTSVSSGGYCYGGAQAGYNFDGATKQNATYKPSYFTCGRLIADSMILGGYHCSFSKVTIGGVEYNILKGI